VKKKPHLGADHRREAARGQGDEPLRKTLEDLGAGFGVAGVEGTQKGRERGLHRHHRLLALTKQGENMIDKEAFESISPFPLLVTKAVQKMDDGGCSRRPQGGVCRRKREKRKKTVLSCQGVGTRQPPRSRGWPSPVLLFSLFSFFVSRNRPVSVFTN
jgi:hypothetical protein